MSIDQTILRLRVEGRERFAVRRGPFRKEWEGEGQEEWDVLSKPDSSEITQYFERHMGDLKSVGQAYDLIMNYAKSVFNDSNCELEIIQRGKLYAPDPEYKL